MFLGRQVDDAITLYYRHILDHGERLSVDQVKDAFWDGWKAAADAEREQLGIAWEADLREDSAFKLGLDAVELTVSELIPHLGEPVAVQRKVEYTLAPGLEWSVLCYLDLETRRPDAAALVPAVVDYKVKTTPLTQFKADHDFQPAVYLAGRWLEGDPAAQFCLSVQSRLVKALLGEVVVDVVSGWCAGGRPCLSRSTARAGSLTGDMMVMGCGSRWGEVRCGRSVFGGRPRGRGGSRMPGAGRGASA